MIFDFSIFKSLPEVRMMLSPLKLEAMSVVLVLAWEVLLVMVLVPYLLFLILKVSCV